MSNLSESEIISSIQNGIHKIVLNRPKKKNALTKKMYIELTRLINESAENKDVTLLALTGNGDFYCSGNDFLNYTEDESVNLEEETSTVGAFVEALILFPKILIAVVNGPSIGITATTLALFDIVYASENAYFSTPFARLGLCAEGCSTYTFPQILGRSKASEMLLLGEKLTSMEALQLGFISKVYKANAEHEIWTYLEKVGTLSKESLAATKRLLRRWNEKKLLEVNKQELIELKKIYGSPDFLENMMKFMTRKSKM